MSGPGEKTLKPREVHADWLVRRGDVQNAPRHIGKEVAQWQKMVFVQLPGTAPGVSCIYS